MYLADNVAKSTAVRAGLLELEFYMVIGNISTLGTLLIQSD